MEVATAVAGATKTAAAAATAQNENKLNCLIHENTRNWDDELECVCRFNE